MVDDYEGRDHLDAQIAGDTTLLLEATGKYEVLTRPSKRLLAVGKALHDASESLGLFRG